MIVKAKSLIVDIRKQYENGTPPFYSTGFTAIDQNFRIGLGRTTYLTGIPAHGKTTFLFEVLINLSLKYEFKHTIFTPETGSPTEIVIELLQMVTMKSFERSHFSEQMSHKDVEYWVEWIDEHFSIVQEGAYTVEEILNIEKATRNGVKGLFTATIDPWNELSHNFTEFGAREDKYLENKLGLFRRHCRTEKIHGFIIAHPKSMQKQSHFDKQTEEVYQYYNNPTAYDLSGGAAWYAKAENIVCVYIPPTHLKRDPKEVEIIIQKAKPRKAGKKGTVPIYYDINKFRYFEMDAASGKFHPAWELAKEKAETEKWLKEKDAEKNQLPINNQFDDDEKPPF